MNILTTQNLTKYYGTGDNLVKALAGINLSIEEGSFISIVGTSGSGKSTLLHMLGGLDTPTSGSITVDNKVISDMNEEELTIFRRRQIGTVFQNYNLVPMLTVWENILLPLQLDGARADETYLKHVTDLLGLADKLNRPPSTLSGGQQQRVAIARALAAKPAILLADEPTGNLDSKTSLEVMGLLKASGKQFHQTIVMITHNEELSQMADNILHLEDGRLVNEEGR